ADLIAPAPDQLFRRVGSGKARAAGVARGLCHRLVSSWVGSYLWSCLERIKAPTIDPSRRLFVPTADRGNRTTGRRGGIRRSDHWGWACTEVYHQGVTTNSQGGRLCAGHLQPE